MAGKQRPKGSFSGHETFPFRYTWLTKAVAAVAGDPMILSKEEAMVELGVGKNMVKSIRHWAIVMGMLEEEPGPARSRSKALSISSLGRKLLGAGSGWDPYLEDIGTIWLLHWQLCSDPLRATTWYWTFNHLPQPEFSKNDLLRWLTTHVEVSGWSRIGSGTIKRDIDCMVRTYVPAKVTRTVMLEDTLDSPLVELGLIHEFGGKNNYMLSRGDQPTLPDDLFAFGLASYVQSLDSSSQTIPLEKLAFAPGSPGRIFCLSEGSLLQRLDQLDELTDGAIVFDETAGLRQVLLRRDCDPADILNHYYTHKAAPAFA